MIIANPIYDVVFKYLLEDTEIARDLLSTILGITIETLQVKPQETLIASDSGDIKIFHLDFKAVIKLSSGEQKTILIELQKAKKSYDILRFRKYLGENYKKEEIRKNAKGEQESYSLEIVTIYILGFRLEGVEVPVLKVGRKYLDAVTEREVEAQNEFITNLTHESYTIQIPRLKLNQKTALEEVLEVFSQENVTEDLHRLDYAKNSPNPIVKKIIKRLSKAAGNEEIRRQMDAEDSIDRILSREINKKLEEQALIHQVEIAEKESQIAEKESQIAEKENQIAEKESQIAEKESQIAEKEALIMKERQEKEALLRRLAEIEKKSDH